MRVSFEKVWTNAAVRVRDGKVEKVLISGAVVPSEFKVIDRHQYTGMPRLIDVHTYMTYWWDTGAGTKPWEQLEHPNPGLLGLHGAGERAQDAGSGRDDRPAMTSEQMFRQPWHETMRE